MAKSTTQASSKLRNICLLGYAPETRDMVMGLDESVEIWGINMAHAFIAKKDGWSTKAIPKYWFQIHPQNWSSMGRPATGYYGRPKEHVDFLARFDGTVWLQAENPDIPNGKVFPFNDVFVKAGRDYRTSTFAYQLALAWYEHTVLKKPVGTIYIYGINLTATDEYFHQKPCVEYWIGRLEEAGVKFEIPSASSLLKGSPYGITTASDDMKNHAFDRLQHYKDEYMMHYANSLVSDAMGLEVRHWAGFLSSVAEKFPDLKENTEFVAAVQAQLDKRATIHKTTSNRSQMELAKVSGIVVDSQHYLAMLGGWDNRANSLPEPRFPSPQLADDYGLPETKTI